MTSNKTVSHNQLSPSSPQMANEGGAPSGVRRPTSSQEWALTSLRQLAARNDQWWPAGCIAGRTSLLGMERHGWVRVNKFSLSRFLYRITDAGRAALAAAEGSDPSLAIRGQDETAKHEPNPSPQSPVEETR